MTSNGVPLPAFDTAALGERLCADLRSDHAGETGAVAIYRGMLALSRDAELRAFAQTHLATEERHLAILDAWLPRSMRSRLLPAWRLAGWLLGAVAALGGRRFAFVTISAVEQFVIEHYEDQIPRARGYADGELVELLETLMREEARHEEDAASRLGDKQFSIVDRWWAKIVAGGSAAAVAAARAI